MLEVCVDTLQAARLAVQHGADRIELSAALEVGGVTPSSVLISTIRQAIESPLIVLIRPRPGDFHFDSDERRILLQEAVEAGRLGADGIAVGGLSRSGELDIDLMKSIAEEFKARFPKKELIVHRAFDSVADPIEAMERLIEWGFSRILTSGGPCTALEGTRALRRLTLAAAGRIELLPAGGIQPENAEQILRESGCRQLHGSFRSPSEPLGPTTSLVMRLPSSQRIIRVRRILDSFLLAPPLADSV